MEESAEQTIKQQVQFQQASLQALLVLVLLLPRRKSSSLSLKPFSGLHQAARYL